MPAPKAKSAAPSGAAPKAKPEKSTASTNGTTTPVTDVSGAAPASGLGKPDKAVHDAEQDSIKKEIDAVQAKLSAIKEKIGGAGKGSPGDARRNELREQLDGLRGQQASNKNSRGKTLDQLKALNDGILKKIQDLQAAKAKTPYKTVADIDAQVKHLDKQIESGNMKISDEKRAIQEISQCKRLRRTVESFEKEQEAIEADRAAADELRKQLDDPELKAVSERYDAIRAELDALKKDADEIYGNRSKLYDERNALQGELDVLYGRKRESAQRFRDANDRYWHKVNEDRARRAERAREQRASEEAEKKTAIAERLREEAAVPAFQAQIEDCQTLIDLFSGKSSAPVTAALAPRVEVVGVPKLELRTVEGLAEGVVARKKKGEEDEAYFVGKGKGKAKGGKKAPASKPATPVTEEPEPASTASATQLNVPLPTLSALLSLSIPPPSSSADVPRVIEDLKTKKAWFEANQKRVTAENIAKGEADIARLTGKSVAPTNGSAVSDVLPVNGGGEKPAEPSHTPQVGDIASVPVPSDEVVEKLEVVQENGDADE